MSRQAATKIHQQKSTPTPSASRLLQRKCACGNHTMAGGECAACGKTKRLGLQTKLKVNEPGDIYEREADRIADQVMATPARPAVSGAPLRIQRFGGQPSGQAGIAPASVDQVLASPGRPLEPTLRQDMEQRFGHDFSRVRVHSGATAEQSAGDVNAYAYTVGHNIVFGTGRFAPKTLEGRRVLAHELTHVVQQSGMDGIRVAQSDKKRGQSNFPVSPNFQRSFLHYGMALQRAPITGPGIKPIPALAPLEVVAREVADLILKNYAAQGLAPGPVLTAVRDTVTGKIYIGLNSGIPPNITDVVAQGISAQEGRIKRKEIIVVRSDPLAKGGHSEANAVNKAVSAREALFTRKVTEEGLRTFELHNIWLRGSDRKFTAAPRCEHCARITRSVSVTSSVYFAEGGVAGEINPPPRGGWRIPRVGPGGATGSVAGKIVPRRGSVTPSGGASQAATTASGEITVPARGSVTPSGGASQAATTASGEITVPLGFRKSLLKSFRAGLVPSAGGIAGEIPGVVLFVADRAAAVEAIRRIQVKFLKEGFAKGVAAGVTGWSQEEVRLNLKNRITSYRVRGLEDPAGFLTLTYILQLAEAKENQAVDVGYQFSSSRTLKWKKDMLTKGFAVLAKRGYHFGEDPQVLFEYDFIERLAQTLHPITNPIVDEAIETGEERRRALESERESERMRFQRGHGRMRP